MNSKSTKNTKNQKILTNILDKNQKIEKALRLFLENLKADVMSVVTSQGLKNTNTMRKER